MRPDLRLVPPLSTFTVEGPVLAEVLVLALYDGQVLLCGPCGPEPWLVEVGQGEDPTTVVAALARNILGELLLVHSTSWRVDRGGVVLTFCAVVPDTGGRDSRLVRRADLARGGATEAAVDVGEAQVIEHGLRHFSWLVTDDEVVGTALGAAWAALLKDYVPEPFRPL